MRWASSVPRYSCRRKTTTSSYQSQDDDASLKTSMFCKYGVNLDGRLCKRSLNSGIASNLVFRYGFPYYRLLAGIHDRERMLPKLNRDYPFLSSSTNFTFRQAEWIFMSLMRLAQNTKTTTPPPSLTPSPFPNRKTHPDNQRRLLNTMMLIAQHPNTSRRHHQSQRERKLKPEPALRNRSRDMAVSDEDNILYIRVLHTRCLQCLYFGDEGVDSGSDLAW